MIYTPQIDVFSFLQQHFEQKILFATKYRRSYGKQSSRQMSFQRIYAVIKLDTTTMTNIWKGTIVQSCFCTWTSICRVSDCLASSEWNQVEHVSELIGVPVSQNFAITEHVCVSKGVPAWHKCTKIGRYHIYRASSRPVFILVRWYKLQYVLMPVLAPTWPYCQHPLAHMPFWTQRS